MGRRLPPGEAERRRQERAKATWGGTNYKQYDSENGFGNRKEWAKTANAFNNGEQFEGGFPPIHSDNPINKNLQILGIGGWPKSLVELNISRRNAVLSLFRELGSDTAPGYSDKFIAITNAYENVKSHQGWN